MLSGALAKIMGQAAIPTGEEVTKGMDLSSKTFLVTGCATGLGFETMRVLCLRNATVLACARSTERAREACAKVAGGKCVPLACCLDDPASVRQCVAQIKAQNIVLDGIIANAGIMSLPALELVQGWERQFMTNHVGHFILVTGLVDNLAPDARVVVTSSEGHVLAKTGWLDNLDGSRGYDAWGAYGASKGSNILFSNELAARFALDAQTRRTSNSLHPGIIATPLSRNMLGTDSLKSRVFMFLGPWFLRVRLYSLTSGLTRARGCQSEAQGAATQIWLATSPEAAGMSGKYFADCRAAVPSNKAQSAQH
jgi:WW domain-containing oxidoreductase